MLLLTAIGLSSKIKCLDNCFLYTSERLFNVYRKQLSEQFILLAIVVNISICSFYEYALCFIVPRLRFFGIVSWAKCAVRVIY